VQVFFCNSLLEIPCACGSVCKPSIKLNLVDIKPYFWVQILLQLKTVVEDVSLSNRYSHLLTTGDVIQPPPMKMVQENRWKRQRWGCVMNREKSVAAWLLLFASAGRRCNGDGLNVIAWSVSVAAGTVLYLLLRYDPVDFCQNATVWHDLPMTQKHNCTAESKHSSTIFHYIPRLGLLLLNWCPVSQKFDKNVSKTFQWPSNRQRNKFICKHMEEGCSFAAGCKSKI